MRQMMYSNYLVSRLTKCYRN